MIGSGTGSTGGGGGLSSISSTTATNVAVTIQDADYPCILKDSGVNVVGFGETTASQPSYDIGGSLRNLVVVFPAGYHIPAALVFTGTGRGGAVATETFTCPGAGGGTVVGSVLFSSIDADGIVNASPGGNGTHIAQIQFGRKIGLSKAPVTAIHKVTKTSEGAAIAASDLTAAWVDVGAITNADFYEIVFSYSPAITQNSHTHEVS